MDEGPLIGVLALQGAFEEHQACLHATGCRSIQVRNPSDLERIDGIILPGGESTAMGLIGTSTTTSFKTTSKEMTSLNAQGTDNKMLNMWDCLRDFSKTKPVWGTCAGMILLAERCIGTSAVIEDGQSLIGGVDITVCRNYFGSQVSSFEMKTPPPPSSRRTTLSGIGTDIEKEQIIDSSLQPYPGVFIRAPAILSAGPDVEILGKVLAVPCRQAAMTLEELERKISSGESVIKLSITNTREQSDHENCKVVIGSNSVDNNSPLDDNDDGSTQQPVIVLPGASFGTKAREVICAVQQNNILCTAFHPELTNDYRWHKYFVQIVSNSRNSPTIA